jgi:hydroxymethylglutaryl-CoA lyase
MVLHMRNAQTESRVALVECPRDAWQGLPGIIPTATKVAYLLALADAGFQHLDAASFVSAKYVPQMADSEDVLAELSRLAAQRGEPEMAGALDIIGIVVNEKGVERALASDAVSTVGYPHSISEQFQRANANMSVGESRTTVEKLTQRVSASGRRLVVYVSMAFGNPYHEIWGPDMVIDTVSWLKSVGVTLASLADTVGTATPVLVGDLFRAVHQCVPEVELGVHLHSRPETAHEKVLATYEAGCRRFDSALTGLGGCPFAVDQLVGNIPTEIVIETLEKKRAVTGVDRRRLPELIEWTNRLRRECSAA